MPARRVVVVFGCPVRPGGLERRLSRARAEAEAAPQAVLVVSGRVVRGDNEAVFMQRWLVEHGVAPSRVLLEPAARDTEENAALSAALVGTLDLERVTLVTDRFHMRRSRWLLALALARVMGARVAVVEAAAADDKPWLERAWLSVSETYKLGWSFLLMLWRRHRRG